MVSQFGSLGYTIMGKTADLTVVQKTIIDSFLLQKMLIDGLSGGLELLMYYCDVFISCLNSHSDGTHSPQRIHFMIQVSKWCNAKFLQICSDD